MLVLTSAHFKTYKCLVCGEHVEYYYPVMITRVEEWTFESLPQMRKYFKSRARYAHESKHKGELDKY